MPSARRLVCARDTCSRPTKDAGALRQPPDSFDEASGVVALPAEWGMNNHDVGTEPARRLG